MALFGFPGLRGIGAGSGDRSERRSKPGQPCKEGAEPRRACDPAGGRPRRSFPTLMAAFPFFPLLPGNIANRPFIADMD
jgi:hypothetical protein